MKKSLLRQILPFFVISTALFITGCGSNTQTDTSETETIQPQSEVSPQQQPTKQDSSETATKNKLSPAEQLARLFEFTNDKAAQHNEYDDIWERIRTGFELKYDVNNPRIQKQLKWYTKHHTYFNRVIKKARPYLHYIVDQIEARGLPTELALLPFIESAYDPYAYSPAHAAGLWQFIPSTGKHFGLQRNWWYDGRRDIHASTGAALTYLAYLSRFFDGEWQLAIAAYNAGEGTLRKAVRRNKKLGRGTDFWSLKLPRETSRYVPSFLALVEIFKHPAKYGIELDSVPNEPHLIKVELESQIDLSLAANLAHLNLKELKSYNPGNNRWATPPKGPHYLLLPIENASKLTDNLASLSEEQLIEWQRYKVKNGDNLGQIAEKFDTKASHIKHVNQLASNELVRGTYLLVPKSSKNVKAETLHVASLDSTQSSSTVTIKHGDTLWDLAKRHNLKADHIAAWNNLSNGNMLKVGQKIKLYSNNKSKKQNRGETRKVFYTVRKGDSLARISKQFNTSIGKIRLWNNLLNKSLIHPGQKLTLHVNVTG